MPTREKGVEQGLVHPSATVLVLQLCPLVPFNLAAWGSHTAVTAALPGFYGQDSPSSYGQGLLPGAAGLVVT